jgi:hypothetical protein
MAPRLSSRAPAQVLATACRRLSRFYRTRSRGCWTGSYGRAAVRLGFSGGAAEGIRVVALTRPEIRVTPIADSAESKSLPTASPEFRVGGERGVSSGPHRATASRESSSLAAALEDPSRPFRFRRVLSPLPPDVTQYPKRPNSGVPYTPHTSRTSFAAPHPQCGRGDRQPPNIVRLPRVRRIHDDPPSEDGCPCRAGNREAFGF